LSSLALRPLSLPTGKTEAEDSARSWVAAKQTEECFRSGDVGRVQSPCSGICSWRSSAARCRGVRGRYTARAGRQCLYL
jgi:hypothetical protein